MSQTGRWAAAPAEALSAAGERPAASRSGTMTACAPRACAPRSSFELRPALFDDSIPSGSLGPLKAWGAPEHPQGLRGAVGASAGASRPAEGRAHNADGSSRSISRISLTLTLTVQSAGSAAGWAAARARTAAACGPRCTTRRARGAICDDRSKPGRLRASRPLHRDSPPWPFARRCTRRVVSVVCLWQPERAWLSRSTPSAAQASD